VFTIGRSRRSRWADARTWDKEKAVKLPGERFDYSPIVSRPLLRLPRRARLVVWTIVNVEDWDITAPMPRSVLPPPAGGIGVPDIPNWHGTITGCELDSGG
jgi:hypothetical protein